MSERESSRFFDKKETFKRTGKRIGRKVGLKSAAGIAGLAIALGGMHGITLDPTPTSEQQAATPQERLALSQDGTYTIVHRSGNSESGIRNAARAGNDFADGDINKIGKQLYLYHGMQEGPFGIDVDTKSFKLGLPDLTIERAFQVAGEEGIGMFLEFKRGDFDEEDAKYVYQQSQIHGVNLFLSSKDLEVVEMAQRAIGDPTVCLYNPYNQEDWNKFLGGSTINAIITTTDWVHKYQPELEERKTNLFVFGINDYDAASSLLKSSPGLVIRGVMNGAAALNDFFDSNN